MIELEKQTATMPLTYTRSILHQTDEFEVVMCLWNKNSFALPHSHGASECFVLVAEGQFLNTRYTGSEKVEEVFGPGQIIKTPLGSQHGVQCLSETGKTLHYYSPKLPRFI